MIDLPNGRVVPSAPPSHVSQPHTPTFTFRQQGDLAMAPLMLSKSGEALAALAAGAVPATSAKDLARSPDTAQRSRILPFASFMAFVGVEELARLMSAQGLLVLPSTFLYYLYPCKVICTTALLACFWGEYRELSWYWGKDRLWPASCLLGLVTFLLWINMDWTLAGTSAGFNPQLLPSGPIRLLLTMFRVGGAVLVVPLMEELFWRSFLLRYLINADFESVPLGKFTWGSFLVSSLLFGLEHHLFWAGVLAGALFSALLYRTRSLTQCVLAHTVTNLALAGYVLGTGRWEFW